MWVFIQENDFLLSKQNPHTFTEGTFNLRQKSKMFSVRYYSQLGSRGNISCITVAIVITIETLNEWSQTCSNCGTIKAPFKISTQDRKHSLISTFASNKLGFLVSST